MSAMCTTMHSSFRMSSVPSCATIDSQPERQRTRGCPSTCCSSSTLTIVPGLSCPTRSESRAAPFRTALLDMMRYRPEVSKVMFSWPTSYFFVATFWISYTPQDCLPLIEGMFSVRSSAST